MLGKVIGWIAYDVSRSLHPSDLADLLNNVFSGYIGPVHATPVSSEAYDDVGVVFTNEPVTEDEAFEYFEKVLAEDYEGDCEESQDEGENPALNH